MTGLTTHSESSIIWNNLTPRQKAWKGCITQAMLILQRDMLTGYALLAAISAFDAINSDIPTELLPAVFKRSMKLTNDKGEPIYWDGRAMWLAFWKLQEEGDGRLTTATDGDVKLLPETAASSCPRCDGTGFERMPDGSRRQGCAHDFADEDMTAHLIERDRKVVEEKAAEMREQLSKLAVAKAMPPAESKHDLTVKFTCSVCGLKVSSTFGWSYNDVCGARIIGPVREDERLACGGKMKVM